MTHVESALTPPAADDVRLSAERVRRTFGTTVALDDVDLAVAAGEIHALIGPNGAGKTTLLRIATGLVAPEQGRILVMGTDTRDAPMVVRRSIGFVPSGDRSFYLRISGLENLSFFGRLQGQSRRESLERAAAAIEQVDLSDAARLRVGAYSHGMHKRLSVARALMTRPPVLLVDEATHDLDPGAARRVRELVREQASAGAAVLWTTQRLEELQGFADRVTVLSTGRVRFAGSVPDLMSRTTVHSYVLRIEQPHDLPAWTTALGAVGRLQPMRDDEAEHLLLTVAPDARLGPAVVALEAAGARVVGCAEATSTIEQAFLTLTDAVGLA